MPRSKKDVLRKRKPAVSKKTKTAKALKPQAPKKTAKAAGASRAEGIRLFKLAGRPTKEQFSVGLRRTRTLDDLEAASRSWRLSEASFKPRWLLSNRGERTPNRRFPRLQ